MKKAKEWLEDARLARQFETMMKGYDIYDGELEELAGGFWYVQLDAMNMAGLEQNEYEACLAYIETDSIEEAAAKMKCSSVWVNTLLKRARIQIDQMLSETTKYCSFKGVS